jgi:hypothetical protein
MYRTVQDESCGGGCLGVLGRRKEPQSTMNLLPVARPSVFPRANLTRGFLVPPKPQPPDNETGSLSPEVISSMLANELLKLSIHEREKAENDVQ